MDETERGGVQVIARAAAILRALENEPDGLSLAEVAREVELARSTVQRIVKALSDEQLVIAASPTARVKIGPALVRLASAFRLDMGQLALPFLRDLSRALGETVDLSVARGSAAVFIEQVLGSERLAAVSHVGDAFPLHNTANGRALLGCLKPAERARLLRGKGRGGAPDEAAVEADVAGFLVSGLAYDRGEHTPGISAVGTAFLDPFGQPFALSVPMPTERFAEKLARVEVALLATRAAIVNLAKGSLPQPG